MSGDRESSIPPQQTAQFASEPPTGLPTPKEAARRTVDALDRRLDQFEQTAGLPSATFSCPEFSQYIEPSRPFLRSLTAEDCGEIALVLAQTCFHLQRVANRAKTTSFLLRERMLRQVVKMTDALQYKTAEEKWAMALLQSEKLAEMESLRLEALARLERVSFLAQRLENVARLYGELQQTKRKQHG